VKPFRAGGEAQVAPRQSSRERRTVEGTRKPALDQSLSGTSLALRGWTDVTAATTTSFASTQRIKTGRTLDAKPLVKGISASQISPARGIVVKSLVLGRVAVQKSFVVAQGRRRFGKLLPAAIKPRRELNKIAQRKLLHCSLNLFDLAHVGNISSRAVSTQASEMEFRKMDY
jgi:hypothetical protein